MRPSNPAALECKDIDRGPYHQWVRRADGTASCLNCGVQLTVEETTDAFPSTSNMGGQSISRKAGGQTAADTAVTPHAGKK